MNVPKVFKIPSESKIRLNVEQPREKYSKYSIKYLNPKLDEIIFSANCQEYLYIGLNSILALNSFFFFSFNPKLLFISSFLSIIIFLSKGPVYSKVWIFIFIVEFLFFYYVKTETPLETLSFIIPMIFIYNSFQNKLSTIVVIGCFSLPSLVFCENLIKLITELAVIRILLKTEGNKAEYESDPLEESDRRLSLNNSSETFDPISSIYDKVLSKLLKIAELLENASKINKDIEMPLSQLGDVIYLLETTPNIYSVSLGEITKNLDSEDRIFIEQNTFQSSEWLFTDTIVISPIKSLPEKVYDGKNLYPILKKIGKDWNFNTMFIDECTGHQSVFTCGEYVLKLLKFDIIFSFPTEKSELFLKTLESKYLKNPYHNSCHSADVMNSFLFLCDSFINNLPSTEIFACVLACLGHDVSHPGKNNRFLIQTKNSLAVHYNDISVLENMHARELFIILNEPSCNIIEAVPDYWHIRKLIIDLILATDMTKHFEFLGNFRYSDKDLDQKFENFADRIEIYKLCIKAADIGHTFKTEDIHEKWCRLIIEEFFAQGDIEKQLGVSVSMYCDRDNTDIRKSQAGFLNNIAMPLYVALFRYLDLEVIDKICISQIRKNAMFWQGKRDSSRQLTTLSVRMENLQRPRTRRITDKNNLD